MEIRFNPILSAVKLSIAQRKGDMNTLNEIRNLDQKRVCDISDDRKILVITKKGCQTIINVNKDGTLQISHKRIII